MQTVLLIKPLDKVGKSIVSNLGDTVTLVEISSIGPGKIPSWKLRGIDEQETWIPEEQKHLKYIRLQ